MRWSLLRLTAACTLSLTLAPAAFACVFLGTAYKQGDEVCFKHHHLQCGDLGSWRELPRCDKDTVTLPPPGTQKPQGAASDGVTPPAAKPPAPDPSAAGKNP